MAVLVHSDGTEEIVKNSLPTADGVQLTVNGGATVKIVDNSKDFIDTRNHWAKDEINFVASRELFKGVTEERFGVERTMTRAMVNIVLARLSGVDTNPAIGQNWYDKGIAWATQNGILNGCADGRVVLPALAGGGYDGPFPQKRVLAADFVSLVKNCGVRGETRGEEKRKRAAFSRALFRSQLDSIFLVSLDPPQIVVPVVMHQLCIDDGNI